MIPNQMNQYINMAWNFAEWLGSRRTPNDILWLYTGFITDSMLFNIVEYICDRIGLIKN